MLPRAPLDPQVYREPFFSLRRPSRSVVSRFLAHLLVRLLIVSALPGQWQAVAALFPVSMLWPLVAPQARAGAPADAGPETRVRGFEQENASCVGREASQAAGTHQAFGLGYGGDAVDRCLFAKARFYDPEVGRFISQDSFLGQVDKPPSLHRYFYGNANPTRYVDPTGHFVQELLEDAKRFAAEMAAVYQRAHDRVVARQGVDLGVASVQGFGIAAEMIRETQQRASNAQAGRPLSGVAAAGNTLISEMVARPLEMISDSGVGAANLALPGGFAMWQGSQPSQGEMAYSLARQQQVAGLKAALDANLPMTDRVAQGLFAVATTPLVVVEGLTWGAGGRASDALGQKAYQAATAPTLTDKIFAGLEAGEQGLTAFGAFGALAAPFTPRPKVWFGDAAPAGAPSGGATGPVNNIVGNQFDEYVAQTKLRGLDEAGQLGRQERLPTPDVPGRNYVQPDYTIYNPRGNVAAYADAKTGVSIGLDPQARGLVEWSKTTTSKTLIYYTPQGTTPVSADLLRYARRNGVRIQQVAAP